MAKGYGSKKMKSAKPRKGRMNKFYLASEGEVIDDYEFDDYREARVAGDELEIAAEDLGHPSAVIVVNKSGYQVKEDEQHVEPLSSHTIAPAIASTVIPKKFKTILHEAK